MKAGIDFDIILTISGTDYGCMLYGPRSLQERDINEFRAGVATGPPQYSDDDIYTVVWQEDWRHGMGFPHYADEYGYAYTGDHVDTRRQGVAQLATALRSVDASGKDVRRFVDYEIAVSGSATNVAIQACGGTGGIRYSSNGTSWTAATDIDMDGTDESVNDLLDAGTYLFAALSGSGERLRKLHSECDARSWADSGTAESGTANTLTDTNKNWTVNAWANHCVYIHTGTGNGQYRIISSNTATVLTVSSNWTTNPGADSQYRIGGWSPAGNDGNAPKNFQWLAKGGGYLWGAQANSNYLHIAAEADGSDFEGAGETDAACIVVGAEDTYITALQWWQNNMMVGKQDGLYMIGSDNVARLKWPATRKWAHNFKYMTIGPDGALYFTCYDRVYRYVGYEPIDITPGQWGVLQFGGGRKPIDGGPDGYAGNATKPPYASYTQFRCMARVNSDVVIVGRTSDATYEEHILYWTGSGWHKLYAPLAAGAYQVYGIGQSHHTNYTFVSVEGSTTTTYGIKMRAGSELPYDDYPTTGNHYLYLSRISLGLLDIPKYLKSLKLRSFNLNSTQTITWAYQIDDNGSWYSLGTQNTSPYQAINFASTAVCKTVQPRANLLAATGAQTPYLDAYALKLLARPDTVYGYAITLKIGDKIPSLQGRTGYTPTGRELITALKAARSSTSPITLTTPLESAPCFVTAYARTGVGYDETGEPFEIVQISLTAA